MCRGRRTDRFHAPTSPRSPRDHHSALGARRPPRVLWLGARTGQIHVEPHSLCDTIGASIKRPLPSVVPATDADRCVGARAVGISGGRGSECPAARPRGRIVLLLTTPLKDHPWAPLPPSGPVGCGAGKTRQEPVSARSCQLDHRTANSEDRCHSCQSSDHRGIPTARTSTIIQQKTQAGGPELVDR